MPMQTLNTYFLVIETAALESAGEVYLPIPDAGRVLSITATTTVGLTTDDSTLTLKRVKPDGTVTAITGGTMVLTQSGNLRGESFFKEFARNADGTDALASGDALEIENDAAPDAGQMILTIGIRR